MGKKVTLKTVENVLKEIERAAFNEYRISSDIENEEVKKIIERGCEVVMKNNAAGIAVGAGGMAAGGVAAAGALLGGGAAAGGAAAGGAAIGGVAMGISGGAAAAGAGAGAVAGAPIPIIGPIVGGVAGLAIGAIVGITIDRHNKNETEALKQQVLKKYEMIEKLKKELEELKEKVNLQEREIARLKYIIGCLAAFNDIENIFVK